MELTPIVSDTDVDLCGLTREALAGDVVAMLAQADPAGLTRLLELATDGVRSFMWISIHEGSLQIYTNFNVPAVDDVALDVLVRSAEGRIIGVTWFAPAGLGRTRVFGYTQGCMSVTTARVIESVLTLVGNMSFTIEAGDVPTEFRPVAARLDAIVEAGQFAALVRPPDASQN